MTRYFCDYCDAYLTHKSASARAQHERGAKHREAFKAYYQKVLQTLGDANPSQKKELQPPPPQQYFSQQHFHQYQYSSQYQQPPPPPPPPLV
jgi:hypothetical protein